MRIAIQIGTNNGNDEFAKECIGSRYDIIYLFEPHTEYNEGIRCIYKNENAVIYNMAVTINQDLKEVLLYRFSDDFGNDSLLFRKSHPLRMEKNNIESISVNCITFMKFCETRGIKDIDYLCIDTEGLDAAIINSINFDKIKIRKIKWEKWNHANDDENGNYPSGPESDIKAIEILTKIGYGITIEDNENYVAIMPPDNKELPWINIKDEDHVYQVIKYLPDNPVIVEAGACDAEDTLRFKTVWPESTIHSFEPNSSLFDIATRNIANKYGPCVADKGILKWESSKISLYPNILCDQNSIALFYESDFPATSSLFPNNIDNVNIPQTVLNSLNMKDRSEYMQYNERPVEKAATTLNYCLEAGFITDIDYLWLDAEGSELLILKGATKFLHNIKVISLELNFQKFRTGAVLFNTIHDYLITRGFDLVAIWEAHENWQANGIYVRKD